MDSGRALSAHPHAGCSRFAPWLWALTWESLLGHRAHSTLLHCGFYLRGSAILPAERLILGIFTTFTKNPVTLLGRIAFLFVAPGGPELSSGERHGQGQRCQHSVSAPDSDAGASTEPGVDRDIVVQLTAAFGDPASHPRAQPDRQLCLE